MSIVIQLLKVIVSIGIVLLGYIILDPARWALLQQPLSLSIPSDFYAMRLERLWFGGTILLLGALCAVSALVTAVRRP